MSGNGEQLEELVLDELVHLEDGGDVASLYVQGVEVDLTREGAEELRDWLTRWLVRG